MSESRPVQTPVLTGALAFTGRSPRPFDAASAPITSIFSGLTEPVCRTRADNVHIPTRPCSYSHHESEHNIIAYASMARGLNVRVCALA